MSTSDVVTLTASTPATVLDAGVDARRVLLGTDGSSAVMFTLDGSTPVLPSGAGGTNGIYVPENAAGGPIILDLEHPAAGEVRVRAISAGGPTVWAVAQ